MENVYVLCITLFKCFNIFLKKNIKIFKTKYAALTHKLTNQQINQNDAKYTTK